MSNGRIKYKQGDMDAIRKQLHLNVKKKESHYDEQKRTSQRKKFCRCPSCGGMMTFVQGTNTLICENTVVKEKTKQLRDGVEQKYSVEEVCGNINLVSDEFQGYLNYLFDGVPPNQAIIDSLQNVGGITRVKKEEK